PFLADALEDALRARPLAAHGDACKFRLEGLGNGLGDLQVDGWIPDHLAFAPSGHDQLRSDALWRGRGGADADSRPPQCTSRGSSTTPSSGSMNFSLAPF